MKKLVFLLAALPGLVGCQALVKGALGIKQEQPLSDQQVRAYVQAQHWQQLPLVRVDSVAYPTLRADVYKPGWPAGFRPLQFLLYNPQGRLVAQYASCEGFLTDKHLATFPPSGLELPDTTRQLAQLLRACRPVAPATALPPARAGEYTLAVYCISWLGRQSTQLVDRMQQYAARYPDKKVRVLLVDADFYQGM